MSKVYISFVFEEQEVLIMVVVGFNFIFSRFIPSSDKICDFSCEVEKAFFKAFGENIQLTDNWALYDQYSATIARPFRVITPMLIDIRPNQIN